MIFLKKIHPSKTLLTEAFIGGVKQIMFQKNDIECRDTYHQHSLGFPNQG